MNYRRRRLIKLTEAPRHQIVELARREQEIDNQKTQLKEINSVRHRNLKQKSKTFTGDPKRARYRKRYTVRYD